MSYANFKDVVQTGDLLLTRSTGNFLSDIQEYFIHAPVTHVSIIIKSKNKLFIYEGTTLRGTAVRELDDYLEKSKCKNIFWRQLYSEKSKLKKELIKYSASHYDWTFLKYVLFHMTNLSFIYNILVAYDVLKNSIGKALGLYIREAYNCSSLVVQILKNLDAIDPTYVTEAIYPSHFLPYHAKILNSKLLGNVIKINY